MSEPTAFAAPEPAPLADALPVVAFDGVSIAFDGPDVLQNVSFSLAPGETRILLGPAGVGKSVLLKLTNGLLRPDEGSIRLFGEEISEMPEQNLFPLRSRIGMVFQEGALFDSLTVRDNVAYQLIQERVALTRACTRRCGLWSWTIHSAFSPAACRAACGGAWRLRAL
jgi:phospholipid/cholesterol/gamma-HCH transport system ATP-binding protein